MSSFSSFDGWDEFLHKFINKFSHDDTSPYSWELAHRFVSSLSINGKGQIETLP